MILSDNQAVSGEASGQSPPRDVSEFGLQRRDYLARQPCDEGVRRLMRAMLKDTLRCYRAYADAKTLRGQRLFREAEYWVHARESSWLFSFENVCHVLGIDSEYLRAELAHAAAPRKRATNPLAREAG